MSLDSQHSVPHPPHADHGLAHVMPISVLLGVFAALIVLTVATVAAAHLQLGDWDIWMAMGIATLKASLVAAYFMHLRYDKPLNCLLFLFTLAFFTLFLGLTLMDSRATQPDVDAWQLQQQKL